METMNQVQWIEIREAEIIQLVRYDSIVSAATSTPTTGRRDVERKTTSIKIFFLHMLVYLSNGCPYTRYTHMNSFLKIFCYSFIRSVGLHLSFFFFLITSACPLMDRFDKIFWGLLIKGRPGRHMHKLNLRVT